MDKPDQTDWPEAYFACPISAGRQDASTYPAITRALSRHCRVLTDFFAHPDFKGDDELEPFEINERDRELLIQADLLVAEISTPSLGVGYEIAKVESLRKPVLCLHRREAPKPSPMITGAGGVTTISYGDPSELESVFADFVGSKFFL